MPPELSQTVEPMERGRGQVRREGGGRAPERAGLSVRLLATESDIEETLPLALAACAESRFREYPLDAERYRRFLAERFVADPVRYGFLIARHEERAVGMLTCHAQRLMFGDVTVVSCLWFYVLGSCRRTLLGRSGGGEVGGCGTSVGAEPQSGGVADARDERDSHRADGPVVSAAGVSPDGRELRDGARRGEVR